MVEGDNDGGSSLRLFCFADSVFPDLNFVCGIDFPRNDNTRGNGGILENYTHMCGNLQNF